MAAKDVTSRDESDAHEDVDDPIDREAAAWVARLSSSDVGDEERQAFADWCVANPAHAAAYSDLEALWRRLGHLPDPRRKSPKILGGLAVIGFLSAGLAFQLGLVDRLRADAWSGVGSIAHLTLSDGSRVDLNTDTAITVDYTAQERRISLLRGEAAFDVVSEPGRPFIVTGAGVRARAVGTRFFVRIGGGDDAVGVAEGRVEVSAVGRHAMVSTGQAVRVDDASLPVAASDVERGMAWRDERLIFAGQSLSTVLRELNRYRHGRILLLDRRLGERRVTGAFDPRDTDEALRVIGATMNVPIRQLSPLLVLVGSPL